MLTILQRFQGNVQILDFCHQLVEHLLRAIYEQDEAKIRLFSHLKESPRGRRFAARRRSSINSINPQSNLGAFGNLITNPNSHNVIRNQQNRSTNAANMLDLDKSPAPGIIDDGDIKNLINPGATSGTDESAEYLAIRMTEKLTINLIQCLSHTGIVVL